MYLPPTRHLLAISASLITMLVIYHPAYGLPFTVNATNDAPDAQLDGNCLTATGVCTLRAAIQEANATIDADVITLPPGKYTLKFVGAGEEASATGDLDVVDHLTINGAGAASTFLKGKKDRVFQVSPGTALTMRDLTVSNGKVGEKGDSGDGFAGGAICSEGDLVLERVVVKNNTAANEGGGISSLAGSLTLTDVSVERNKALDDGGGIELIGTDATFTRVTISRNKAANKGGGLHVVLDSAASMDNCTVSGNRAKGEGGGIRIESTATLTLTNVTLSGNKTKEGAGGIDRSPDAGTTTVRNVILNKNKPANCFGALTLDGGNLESADSCGLAPGETNLTIGLKGLKNNGGATKTHALKEGNPAIDFGIDANCPPEDQRGHARVDVPGVGVGTCDSGAFEFVPAP